MKRYHQQTPDWAAMIAQMCERGLTYSDIGKATSSMLTHRMVRHYATGVQPLYWRGEQMIELWCATLKLKRENLPMADIVRGHRADRREHVVTPVLRGDLPQWPPADVVEVKPKRKYTRRVAEV